MTPYLSVFQRCLSHGPNHTVLSFASLLLLATGAQGQGTTATPQCAPLPMTWVQVNGAYTEEPQYVDAGEPINAPRDFRISARNAFSSVVTGNGDLIYTVPSPCGTRLGRFTTTKQWQMWTSSGWSGSPALTPRIIENTVLVYIDPKLYPHPQYPNGFLGVSNAQVHSGGTGFDFHNFRASFEFDGEQFTHWTGNTSPDPFYAKQLIPSRAGDPVDFAYDADTQTGIAVGGFGSDGNFDPAKFTAVRFQRNNATRHWFRWDRSSESDLGHWHTDDDGWLR